MAKETPKKSPTPKIVLKKKKLTGKIGKSNLSKNPNKTNPSKKIISKTKGTTKSLNILKTTIKNKVKSQCPTSLKKEKVSKPNAPQQKKKSISQKKTRLKKPKDVQDSNKKEYSKLSTKRGTQKLNLEDTERNKRKSKLAPVRKQPVKKKKVDDDNEKKLKKTLTKGTTTRVKNDSKSNASPNLILKVDKSKNTKRVDTFNIEQPIEDTSMPASSQGEECYSDSLCISGFSTLSDGFGVNMPFSSQEAGDCASICLSGSLTLSGSVEDNVVSAIMNKNSGSPEVSHGNTHSKSEPDKVFGDKITEKETVMIFEDSGSDDEELFLLNSAASVQEDRVSSTDKEEIALMENKSAVTPSSRSSISNNDENNDEGTTTEKTENTSVTNKSPETSPSLRIPSDNAGGRDLRSDKDDTNSSNSLITVIDEKIDCTTFDHSEHVTGETESLCLSKHSEKPYSKNIEEDLFLSSSPSRHSSITSFTSSDSGFGIHDLNKNRKSKKRKDEQSPTRATKKFKCIEKSQNIGNSAVRTSTERTENTSLENESLKTSSSFRISFDNGNNAVQTSTERTEYTSLENKSLKTPSSLRMSFDNEISSKTCDVPEESEHSCSSLSTCSTSKFVERTKVSSPEKTGGSISGSPSNKSDLQPSVILERLSPAQISPSIVNHLAKETLRTPVQISHTDKMQNCSVRLTKLGSLKTSPLPVEGNKKTPVLGSNIEQNKTPIFFKDQSSSFLSSPYSKNKLVNHKTVSVNNRSENNKPKLTRFKLLQQARFKRQNLSDRLNLSSFNRGLSEASTSSAQLALVDKNANKTTVKVRRNCDTKIVVKENNKLIITKYFEDNQSSQITHSSQVPNYTRLIKNDNKPSYFEETENVSKPQLNDDLTYKTNKRSSKISQSINTNVTNSNAKHKNSTIVLSNYSATNPTSYVNRPAGSNFIFSEPQQPNKNVRSVAENFDREQTKDDDVLSIFAPTELEMDLTCIVEDTPQISKKPAINFTTGKTSRKSKFEYIDNSEHEEENIGQYQRSNDNVATWIQDNVPSKSLPCSSHQNNSLCSSLVGTILDGYCLSYLRSSVDKQLHKCNLRHELPNFEIMNRENEDKVVKAIQIIIQDNFSNPPPPLLSLFVKYLLKIRKRNSVVQIGNALKLNVNIDSGKEAELIWRTYINVLISTEMSLSRFGADISRTIQSILKQIFVENNEIKPKYIKVIQMIMDEIAEASKIYKNLKVLICVDFLRTYFSASLYPLNFKFAVIKQVVQMETLVEFDNQTKYNFTFKVYRTLFPNGEDLVEMLKFDHALVSSFISILKEFRIGLASLSKLTSNEKSYESTSRFVVRNPAVANGSSSVSQAGSGYPQLSRYAPSNNWQRWDEEFNTLKNLIIKGSDPLMLASKFENCQQLLTSITGQLFNIFHKLVDGQRYYQNILAKCSDNVKELLSDITMSFLLLKARDNLWNDCYLLFKNIVNFNPKTIKDFINDNHTRAWKLLTIIQACLNTLKVNEAVDLFVRYHLFNENEAEWLLPGSAEDKYSWRKVCLDINTSLKSSNLRIGEMYSPLSGLIKGQKSLLTPIDIRTSIREFVSLLVDNNEPQAAANLISFILDSPEWKTLLKQVLLSGYLFRVLLITMVKSNDINLAERLFYKAKDICNDYQRDIFKNDYNPDLTLKTNLSEEEMFVIIRLKLTRCKINSNPRISFKIADNSLLMGNVPFLNEIDCSISKSMERFRTALRKVFPQSAFLNRDETSLTIDRITLESYNNT